MSIGLAILLFLLLIATPAPCLAHASLESSAPPPGTVLAALPEAVELRFSEPVTALTLLWHLPDGRQLEGSAEEQGRLLRIAAPPDLGTGGYTISWRVVSADGHPISGATGLAVGAEPATAEAGDAAAERPWLAAAAIGTRLAAMLAMILAVGAGLFAAHVAPPRPVARAILRRAARWAAPLALLAIGAYGLDLLHLPPAALASLPPWQAALGQPRGAAMLLMPLAAAVSAMAVLAVTGGPPRRAAVWLALAMAAASLAISGHAATGAQAGAGRVLMLGHAAALILWIGGLPCLLVAVAGRRGLGALRRFSAVALPAVILLSGSGFGMVLLRVTEWQALAGSSWGRLLAAKLVLVAVMLVLALANRLMLMPALAGGTSATRRRAVGRLRRSIAAEIALGVAVLLVALCFRLTPPPAAAPIGQDAAGTRAGYARLEGDGAVLDLDIRPMPPGRVTVVAYPGDPNGEPLQPRSLRLILSADAGMPGTGQGLAEVTFWPGPEGGWRSAPVDLPHAGPWQIEARIGLGDGREVIATGEFGP
ncbi:copper resistance CopC/CopD family protein [Paracoccus spongiarum]|uniref:CopD family protein n=1 Tax=Paracoccus spongiarum TaxID=3064387 RepID=A0ABT9JGJ7_9RHOB|nr:CopD family protein [Paracoccus sp. 2205BS29-5]MDP5308906.1 CopD family protein [Paracoccus sp. 2205BS29-5]